MNTAVTKAAASGQLMPRSIIADMAERFGMEKEAFESTLMKTVMPANGASKEQVAAFLVVAKHYDLNPFTREIFAFPAKGGGIQPVVSIDGWLKILNANPYYDGMEFKDHVEDGELVAITCRIHHKHRTRPIEVTEYMAECKRNTDPWRQWPVRMLRHKSVIQCARYAFGFSGIIEPDEYERIGTISENAALPGPIGVGVAGLRRALIRDEPQSQRQAPADEPAKAEPDAYVAETETDPATHSGTAETGLDTSGSAAPQGDKAKTTRKPPPRVPAPE